MADFLAGDVGNLCVYSALLRGETVPNEKKLYGQKISISCIDKKRHIY
jgi:hypothetical protein